jgi:hypothetical protein
LGGGDADRRWTEQDRAKIVSNLAMQPSGALLGRPDVATIGAPAALVRNSAPLENLPTLFTIPSRCL